MIKEAITMINQMQADGVIGRYAIGGAIGATFYLEPVSTVDLDIFVALSPPPGQFIISLQPIYEYLKNQGAVPEGEYILVSGWPVQFLVPNSPLVDEALTDALETNLDGEPVWVFQAEHLAAIALQTGRPKDKARLLQFIEEGVVSIEQFEKIVEKYKLETQWARFKDQFLGDDSHAG